jgi:DNA-binding MarR family transcriptional regulator
MPVSRVADLPTWMLSRANARAQGLLYEAFAEVGLRPVHYRAMAALDEHGDLSQAELGRHLGLDRKDVAVAVDFLSGRDLISRSPDPADARRKIVALTDAGRGLLPALNRALAEVQRQVLAPLSAREAKDLLRLLAKLGGTSAD